MTVQHGPGQHVIIASAHAMHNRNRVVTFAPLLQSWDRIVGPVPRFALDGSLNLA